MALYIGQCSKSQTSFHLFLLTESYKSDVENPQLGSLSRRRQDKDVKVFPVSTLCVPTYRAPWLRHWDCPSAPGPGLSLTSPCLLRYMRIKHSINTAAKLSLIEHGRSWGGVMVDILIYLLSPLSRQGSTCSCVPIRLGSHRRANFNPTQTTETRSCEKVRPSFL